MHLEPRRIEVVDNDLARVLRLKTGAERLQIASGLFASARRMLIAKLRKEHPEWDPSRVNEEVVRRLSHGAI